MKNERSQKITVIGERLAKPGAEFIFAGEMPECKKCKVRGACLNLEAGRRYKIDSVREGHLMDCALHDGGVLAVVVTPAAIEALTDTKKAVKGATVVYEPLPVNDAVPEEFRKYLAPEGLLKGDKCRIDAVGESVSVNGKAYKIAAMTPEL